MSKPLVSVIVPTKNSAATLEACLKSIREQSYKNIELIVVDNFSTDATQEIAKKYADKVFEKGPERSAQRNFAALNTIGTFVVFVDSDMELSKEVTTDCVTEIDRDSRTLGVVIPEESFGHGFWAQCKKLERSFYVGISFMEAARFFNKEAFNQAGGYNEKMVSGEDWDLSQRVEKLGKLGRITSFIYHNEGKISLLQTMRKKYYYAREFSNYTTANDGNSNVKNQTSILGRYALFFSQPSKLFRNPVIGIGMLWMKTCEFLWGGIGYLTASLRKSTVKVYESKSQGYDRNISEII